MPRLRRLYRNLLAWGTPRWTRRLCPFCALSDRAPPVPGIPRSRRAPGAFSPGWFPALSSG